MPLCAGCFKEMPWSTLKHTLACTRGCIKHCYLHHCIYHPYSPGSCLGRCKINLKIAEHPCKGVCCQALWVKWISSEILLLDIITNYQSMSCWTLLNCCISVGNLALNAWLCILHDKDSCIEFCKVSSFLKVPWRITDSNWKNWWGTKVKLSHNWSNTQDNHLKQVARCRPKEETGPFWCELHHENDSHNMGNFKTLRR